MSVAADIAGAIVTKLKTLSLVPEANVVRRKTPSLPQGTEPPAIVVTVGAEGDVEPMTARKDFVRYPVTVTLFTAGGKLLADDTALRNWREQIRVAVNQRNTFAGVSQFNQVSPSGRAVYDGGAGKVDINASVYVFTVEAIEDRS